MENLKNPLKNLGFSDKEADIYIALLELGQASYTDLAKTTGLKRTSIYPIIAKMEEKGIVHHLVDTKKLSAVSPEELFKILQANTLQFHKFIPQLKDLARQDRAISRVKFYPGVEGIKQAYIASYGKLPPKKDRQVYVIGNAHTWNQFWARHNPGFTEEYIKNIKAKYYQSKLLMSGQPEEPYTQKWFDNAKLNAQIKYLPPDHQSEFDMEIHPTHIVIADLKSDHPYAIRIVSTELARALMSFFDFTWHLYSPSGPSPANDVT